MATDSEVRAYMLRGIDRNTFLTNVADYVDYCIEWDRVPNKDDFDRWYVGDRKSLFDVAKRD